MPTIMHVPSNEQFVLRIRALYKHYGSARKMGPALGVHWVTIYRWLKGDVDVMKLPLRTYFNVMGGVSNQEEAGGNGTGAPHPDGGEDTTDTTDAEMPPQEDVPVYREDMLAAHLSEHGLPTGVLPPETLVGRPSEFAADPHVYGVRVSSRSVYPVMEEGTIAIVAPSRSPLPDRFVVANLRSGEVVIRKYSQRDGKVVLRAANDDFAEMTINPDKVNWMYPVVWLKLP